MDEKQLSELSREKFEAYCRKNGLCVERGVQSGIYASLRTNDFWEIWLAASKESAEEAEQRIAELKAKLAMPVRPPKKDDLIFAGCNSTRLAINFRNSAIDEYSDAIRAAGFTVGDE